MSELISEKYEKRFRKGRCYENVEKVLMAQKLHAQDTEVLFCFTPMDENASVYCRHAFVIYSGEIIEPVVDIPVEKMLGSIVPIKLFSLSDYYAALVKDGRYSLTSLLHAEEVKAFVTSGISLNVSDLKSMIERVTRDSELTVALFVNAMEGDRSLFLQYLEPVLLPCKKKENCSIALRRSRV